MRYFITTLLLFTLIARANVVNAQIPIEPVKVDRFDTDSMHIDVYFYDQLKWLMNNYPGFKTASDKEKTEIFMTSLSTQRLYSFVVRSNEGEITTYIIRGNPAKANSSRKYQLDIINGDASNDTTLNPEASLTQFGLGGDFFENMELLHNRPYRGMESIKLWGMFWFIRKYDDVKKVMMHFINQDKSALIAEYKSKINQLRIQPKFSYEQCAISKVKSRTFEITVNRTDQFGKWQQDIREEKSNFLYESATDSNDISGVTAFPYFAKDDTLLSTTRTDSFLIRTSQPYLLHYLKNIYLILDTITEEIKYMGGILLIHGYTIRGQSVHEEIFNLLFSRVGSCTLPTQMDYYGSDDKWQQRPLVRTKISYVMKE